MRTYGAATRHGRSNRHSRSTDIDKLAVVGAAISLVVGLSAANRANTWLRRRGFLASIPIEVASGSGNKVALLDEGCDGVVHGLQSTVGSQAEVDDYSLGAVLPGRILGDVVYGVDDTGVGAAGVASEDLETKDFGLLGDTVRLAGNGSTDVGAMAVIISVGVGDP